MHCKYITNVALSKQPSLNSALVVGAGDASIPMSLELACRFIEQHKTWILNCQETKYWSDSFQSLGEFPSLSMEARLEQAHVSRLIFTIIQLRHPHPRYESRGNNAEHGIGEVAGVSTTIFRFPAGRVDTLWTACVSSFV